MCIRNGCLDTGASDTNDLAEISMSESSGREGCVRHTNLIERERERTAARCLGHKRLTERERALLQMSWTHKADRKRE